MPEKNILKTWEEKGRGGRRGGGHVDLIVGLAFGVGLEDN